MCNKKAKEKGIVVLVASEQFKIKSKYFLALYNGGNSHFLNNKILLKILF